jgi:hypothetical protein
MSVDKKRQALEEEIAAERAKAKKSAPKDKVKPGLKPKPKDKKRGQAARPKFLFVAAAAVIFVALGLTAGPKIGDWLNRSYDNLIGTDSETAGGPAITLDDLDARVAGLASRLEAIEQQDTPDLSALIVRLEELEAQFAAVAGGQRPVEGIPDAATDETRAVIEALQVRLSAVEARKVGTAGSESLSLVVALLAQRAVAGRSFRVELSRLEARLPTLSETEWQEAAALIERLRPQARSGVATQQAIRLAFPPLIVEALTSPGRYGEESAWRKIWAEISGLIVIRRTGEVEGEDLEARLARAELRLQGGDLYGAVAEVGAIEDAARVPLEGWLADARQRLEVIETVIALELLIDEVSRSKE